MLVSLIFSEIQAHNERITGCNHRWLTLPNYIGIQWAHGISLKVLCNYIDRSNGVCVCVCVCDQVIFLLLGFIDF